MSHCAHSPAPSARRFVWVRFGGDEFTANFTAGRQLAIVVREKRTGGLVVRKYRRKSHRWTKPTSVSYDDVLHVPCSFIAETALEFIVTDGANQFRALKPKEDRNA